MFLLPPVLPLFRRPWLLIHKEPGQKSDTKMKFNEV